MKKKKYWYITYIKECVICGKEQKYRERVKNKPKSSIDFKQFACDTHFI